MENESENKAPNCCFCGKPVIERCERAGKAGAKGEYRKWHLQCSSSRRMAEKRAEDAASIRLNEMERDDCLLRAWIGRRDALDFLAREIADYNEIVPDHDRMVVRMVYRLVRTAILMFRIDPMIPVEYGEDFRRIAIEIGSDGMDLIADSVRWHGARRWRDDPDVSAEGAAPRTFYGKIAVPGENLEDEYTADLTHETDIVTYKKALEYIWREDNITGGRWNRDIGPWSYK